MPSATENSIPETEPTSVRPVRTVTVPMPVVPLSPLNVTVGFCSRPVYSLLRSETSNISAVGTALVMVNPAGSEVTAVWSFPSSMLPFTQ